MTLPNPDSHNAPTLPPPGGDLKVPPPFRSAGAPEALPLVFTGRGGEYFGIWIVNLLLTIVTFGIYSAWAKVRPATWASPASTPADWASPSCPKFDLLATPIAGPRHPRAGPRH